MSSAAACLTHSLSDLHAVSNQRAIVEHYWRQFGRRYALQEMGIFYVCVLLSFTCFSCTLALSIEGEGELLGLGLFWQFMISFLWVLRHIFHEGVQFANSPTEYIKSTWNKVDLTLILFFWICGGLLFFEASKAEAWHSR